MNNADSKTVEGSPQDAAVKHRYLLKHFEGPLDLLLFLIRKNEIDIHDIPIAEITAQYLDYLRYVTAVNLDDITEFYLLAATMLHIKSRMLLPMRVDLDEELGDPRHELVQQLIEYEKMRKFTDLMAERESRMEWTVERKSAQRVLPFAEEDALWSRADVWDLLKVFSKIMKELGGADLISLWEEVTIQEKITLIYELMETREEFFFDDVLINSASMMEIIAAFLALLELVKGGLVEVFQNRLFGDIKIHAREREENHEA